MTGEKSEEGGAGPLPTQKRLAKTTLEERRYKGEGKSDNGVFIRGSQEHSGGGGLTCGGRI